MCSDKLVEKIASRFQTYDVYKIAMQTGVKIVFQKWFPVTAGEFDWKTKTIVVNENAPVEFEKIIAHELGHFFIREFKIENITDEEKFCDEFADKLLFLLCQISLKSKRKRFFAADER